VLRFLLSRRWLLFGVAVAVLAVACWRLGEWQFDRLEERRADNRVIEGNLQAPPADVTEVMSPDHDLPRSAQWRAVTATGKYDVDEQVLVRYRTRDGRPGVDVVTPLVLDDGERVLVERGWSPAPNSGSAQIDVPTPPAGQVQVSGWARLDQSGESGAIVPSDGQVRLIDSSGFAEVLPAPLLRGYVSLEGEDPAPRTRLEPPERPELNSGPHFFYGLQWWFFGALALGGFGYFAYVEARDRRRAG
jgi:cytochrome oxidase assembly protein ShyY1